MDQMQAAIRLLENLTPLRTDCGALCGQACCQPDSDAGGEVWLLPCEEEALFPWADVHASYMPVTGTVVTAIACKQMCSRPNRPFLCRIFPLAPYYSKKRGAWDVRMDQRAWMLCPLTGYGIRALDPEFVAAARKAVQMLAEDPETAGFLKALQQEESAYRIKL